MDISTFISRRIVFSSQQSFTRVLVGIAIASVAISVAVMLASMAVITGFKETITDKIFGFWGHIHITDSHVSRSYEPVAISADTVLVNQIYAIRNSDWDERLDDEKSVKHIQSFAFLPGILQSKLEIEGIVLKGLGKDNNDAVLSGYLLEGTMPNWADSIAGRDILISKQTANRIGANLEDKVIVKFFKDNDYIKRAFTITGIYKTGLEEYDIKFAMVDIRNLQEVLGWDSTMIAGYEIFTNNASNIEPIADYIYSDLLPSSMYSETIQEKFPSIFDWLSLQSINEQIIIFLMLLVCIINMATILLIVILERAQMVGLLKSLGATNKSIRSLFLRYAFWIISIGLAFGNFLGLAFCVLQKHYPFIHLDEENYYVSVAPIVVKWHHVLGINLLSIILILVCMWLPTVVAARIRPVNVLRFN